MAHGNNLCVVAVAEAEVGAETDTREIYCTTPNVKLTNRQQKFSKGHHLSCALSNNICIYFTASQLPFDQW